MLGRNLKDNIYGTVLPGRCALPSASNELPVESSVLPGGRKAHQGLGTQGGLSSGLVPAVDASMRDTFVTYGTMHQGMDTFSGLSSGLVPAPERSRKDAVVTFNTGRKGKNQDLFCAK